MSDDGKKPDQKWYTLKELAAMPKGSFTIGRYSDEERQRLVAESLAKMEATEAPPQSPEPDRWITMEELLKYPPGSVKFKADSPEELARRVAEALKRRDGQ